MKCRRTKELSDLDIIFISYKESNADKNWIELKSRFPRAKRVHGVKGILEAHGQAAEKSQTSFFFVVDGDNRIKPDFQFVTPEVHLSEDTLYVWRCYNPINDLVYGYGAIKLYNKTLLKQRHQSKYVDLATTVTEKYHIIHEVASETHFNSSPEEAWRGGFRECAKLAAETIRGQKSDETKNRLNQWCEKKNSVRHADWVLRGAQQGRAFGEKYSDQLHFINDFTWLEEEFQKNV